MTGFEFQKLKLDGVRLISSFFAGDARGGFTKTFKNDVFRDEGISFELSETFASVSSRNVVRGIHFQLERPQAKIVSVLSGRVIDIVVDLRPGSTTYTQWIAEELSETNHKSLYVPKGFGHAFAALEDGTIMLYQCEGEYLPDKDTGIVFNSPEIGIKWPISEADMILSERDKNLMSFEEYNRIAKKGAK